jgi:hypothetical protein
MYSHEVLMSLQTRAKLFGTHYLHGYVREIRLSQMTGYQFHVRCKQC